MNRPLFRQLARCRRLLFAVYALPGGTLPPDLDDAIADLLMPGYRARVTAAYLVTLTPPRYLAEGFLTPEQLEERRHRCRGLVAESEPTLAPPSAAISRVLSPHG
jgi:hypothetical protein